MISTLYLVLLFTLVKNVFSVFYVFDLDIPDYKNICQQLKTTGSLSQCVTRFKPEDHLELRQGSKIIWSSNDKKLVDVIITSKSGRPELVQVSFRSPESEEVESSHFYREEEGFSPIDPEIYHVLLGVLQDPTRIFDVNILSGQWFTTVDHDRVLTHYVNSGFEVGSVVDDKSVIWENSTNSTVTALKLEYTDYGPQNCEIFIQKGRFYERLFFEKDDLGWHFVNGDKVPLESCNLDPKYATPTRSPVKIAQEQRAESSSQGASGVTENYDPNQLILSLGDWILANKPSGVDVGSYYTCGFDTRVYKIVKRRISSVAEGRIVIWRKSSRVLLSKATLSKSQYHDELYLELAVVVLRNISLPPIKKLKPKRNKNMTYTDYLNYYKKNGIWIPMSRVDYLTTMDSLVDEHVSKNPHKVFDESILSFFKDVNIVPLETLSIRRRIDTRGPCYFLSSLWCRFFKRYTQVVYNLENSPRYLFEVVENSEFPSFRCLRVRSSYALIRIIDGKQVLWSISEDGLGCIKLYHFRDGDTNLIHLRLDADIEKHKYFELRREYWYDIEAEEFMGLMNEKVLAKRNMLFSYYKLRYQLVTQEVYNAREEEKMLEERDESEDGEEYPKLSKRRGKKKDKKKKKEYEDDEESESLV